MPSRWRTVRVFISSTFRDMHAERDHLVKVVFPELRERLERHRIHLVDIDLRWGVTKEQADNDRVLDLCLDLIDDCRPFFIGILGERYGWVPESFPQQALSKHGWVQHQTGKSITALEIIHGVLRDPRMQMQSFFYFRNPSFTADVPGSMRSELEAESPESARKLAVLKEEIRSSGLPVREYECEYGGLRVAWRLARADLAPLERKALEEVARHGLVDREEYASLDEDQRRVVEQYGVVDLRGLEAFGQWVREDLWEGVCRQFPELLAEEKPAVTAPAQVEDWLAQEQDYHERFVESRTQVYVGREAIHRELLAYVDGDDTVPLVVSGPSGSGKSAILARLYTALAERDGLALVVPHFVGASPKSSDLRSMLWRFCLTLRERFSLTETELPEEVEKLPAALRELLSSVPGDAKVVLLIDALDQLDERYHAHGLHWLPRELPSTVKVVLSCIEGEETGDAVLQILRRSSCVESRVAPLTGEERFEIVTRVPSMSAKTLDPKQTGLLLSNPATQNPLFLLVALEELRGFGSFEQLDRRIKAFPREGDTVTALFDQVLERLEEEFNSEVVRSLLPLLAVSRHGLTEGELRELVQDIDTRAELFVILRQLRPYLLKRGELVDFYHRNLYRAVRRKYLPTDEARCAAHTRLAEYFHAQDYWMESLEDQRARVKRLPPTPRPANVRKVDELPWHLLEVAKLAGGDDPKSEHWNAVADLLMDSRFLEAKVEAPA